jgi:hypothetical protein
MDTGEAFASREMDADERKKARQREFEYSPEIVKAAESEKRAQAARKKVTDIKSYERRRELNKIDADRDKGIDDHVVDAMAQAIIERATRPIAADTLERDLSASLGSVDNPLPLPEPITGEEEPERPGAEPRDLYATAETDGEAPEDAPERGSALNPTPLDPPPQGDRH